MNPFAPALALCRAIDRISDGIGRTVYWLLLAAVLVSTINALVRYVFDASSNAWLELQWYLFAAVFMLGAGYVFLHDQHVRIDAVSARFPRRVQVWIDVVGIVVVLLPLCGFVVWTSWPSVIDAWASQEVSASPGGLVRWPLYALVPAGFALLALQGLSELLKRLAFLYAAAPDPHARPEETDDERLLQDMLREAQGAANGSPSQGGVR